MSFNIKYIFTPKTKKNTTDALNEENVDKFIYDLPGGYWLGFCDQTVQVGAAAPSYPPIQGQPDPVPSG